jgi:hypothetical protein
MFHRGESGSRLAMGSVNIVSQLNGVEGNEHFVTRKRLVKGVGDEALCPVLGKKHRMGVTFLLNSASETESSRVNFASHHSTDELAKETPSVVTAPSLFPPFESNAPTTAAVVRLEPIEPSVMIGQKSADCTPRTVMSAARSDDGTFDGRTLAPNLNSSPRHKRLLVSNAVTQMAQDGNERKSLAPSGCLPSCPGAGETSSANEAAPRWLPETAARAKSVAKPSGDPDEERPAPSAQGASIAGVMIGNRRSFPCGECGFVFGMRSNLKRHILTVHEDKRIFRCALCQASFGLKQNLVTHVRVKHERRRPFACPVCRLTFGYKQVLQNHIRNIHK